MDADITIEVMFRAPVVVGDDDIEVHAFRERTAKLLNVRLHAAFVWRIELADVEHARALHRARILS
jgi:hypothetical protein